MNSNIMRVGVLGCALILGSVAAPMGGCQGGAGGLWGAKSAMDMLSPAIKDAANSYIGNLSSLTSSLDGLKDLQSVMEFVKKVEPTVKELSTSYNTLSATTGSDRSNLLEAFGPKFQSVNKSFLSQASASKSNSLWGNALAPVLDKVKLFQ